MKIAEIALINNHSLTLLGVVWPFNGTLKYGQIRQVVSKYRLNVVEMYREN